MCRNTSRTLIPIAALAWLAMEFAAAFSPVWAGEAASAARAAGPFEQNRRLGRGVNIIGYDPLWRSRDKARFQDRHFALIREAGFTSVRINLHPWRDRRIDAKDRLQPDWLDTLDWAVSEALKHKLRVILDLHEFEAMGRDPQGNRERFLATWRQLAERFAGSPGDVFFEILNEPNKKLTPELWNEYAGEALKIIRKTNPVRTVIVGPAYWNNIDFLEKLELPADDRNVIVTVHYYKPMTFTHQGASWTGQKDKVGIPWNGTPQEREAIQRDFAKAQAWAEKHSRPIYLGEFGAYDKADMPSRVRYIGFVAREAEKRGWSWAYWQFDGDFIVFDIKNQRWVQPILDALIPSDK
jgi:endoglucanase